MKISNTHRYAVLMLLASLCVFTASCKDEVTSLPPESSAEDKTERVKIDLAEAESLKEEQDVKKEILKKQEQIANLKKNMIDASSFTKEEIIADTEMDPYVKEAILQAKQKQEDKIKAREELMQREQDAKKIIEKQDLRKIKIAEAIAAYDKVKDEQSRLAETERKKMNADGVAPKGMVWVPGGKFLRGNHSQDEEYLLRYAEEYPEHVAEVSGFYMDATEVTNAQFAEFVKATGYVTMAERGLDAKDFPQAEAVDLQGGSNVFKKTHGSIDPWVGSAWRWWAFTPGATWKTPEGPGSSITDKMDHPVSCVNYDDAAAYAKWAGKRLPTEAEWERAAKAGHDAETYMWGDEMLVDGKWLANVYQGEFPSHQDKDDGYLLTAPVKSYPANDWGLYDMAGNVWEICSDYYHPGYYYEYALNPVKNPQGPTKAITDMERVKFDRVTGTCPEPREGLNVLTKLRVARGGSFLCSSQYCKRFRPAARHHHEPLTPSQHMGFRCVQELKK